MCACVCVCIERERKWKEGIDFPLSHCSTYTIYILAGLEVFQVLAPTSKERKSDEQSSAPLLHCFERKSPAGTSLSWPVSTLCIYIYSKYSATEREKRWQLERERRTVRERVNYMKLHRSVGESSGAALFYRKPRRGDILPPPRHLLIERANVFQYKVLLRFDRQFATVHFSLSLSSRLDVAN